MLGLLPLVNTNFYTRTDGGRYSAYAGLAGTRHALTAFNTRDQMLTMVIPQERASGSESLNNFLSVILPFSPLLFFSLLFSFHVQPATGQL
jgi:hypothetical protein